jgi:hypothetical protein
MMKNYIFIFVAAIMLLGVQNSVNAADYVLTVTGGTGSGTYAEASVANIVAAAAPSGMVFDRWLITEGIPVIDNLYNGTTTLTMPAMAVNVQALFMDEGPNYFDNCDALTGGFCDWSLNGTRTTLSVNTADMIQGAGCLENTLAGTNTTLFVSPRSTDVGGAATAKNTGVTLANGILRLRFWIEDVTKLGNNLSIEIGSGGLPDQAEIQFNVTKANIKNGLNNLNLKLSAGGILAGAAGQPNMEAINWFRMYSSGSVAGLKARLDGIMVYEPTLTKVDPPILWTPANIVVNTALGATQLNATSPIPGAYTYNPVSGTVMAELGQKELKVTFTPSSWHQFIYNTIIDKIVNVSVVETLSSVNNPTESAFSIYPNPLKSNGILNINVAEQDNYTLRISNMNGQTVYSSNLNGSQTLNVNGVLKQGAYIVSLISSKSTRNQKLFIE